MRLPLFLNFLYVLYFLSFITSSVATPAVLFRSNGNTPRAAHSVLPRAPRTRRRSQSRAPADWHTNRRPGSSARHHLLLLSPRRRRQTISSRNRPLPPWS